MEPDVRCDEGDVTPQPPLEDRRAGTEQPTQSDQLTVRDMGKLNTSPKTTCGTAILLDARLLQDMASLAMTPRWSEPAIGPRSQWWTRQTSDGWRKT